MWPFSKKPAPQAKKPHIEALNPKELQWLVRQREILPQLAQLAGVPFEAESRLAACDEAIKWWHREPVKDRLDPNIVINACGVALGDALAAACELEWKIITDEFGTNMGLWSGDSTEIVLSPSSSIAKRFSISQQGCVVALYETMRSQVQALPRH